MPNEQPGRRPAAPPLPGNHRYWVADPAGFGAWKPLNLDTLQRTEDDDIVELIYTMYKPNDVFSQIAATIDADALSMIVHETMDADADARCQQFPYIVNIEVGDGGTWGDYYVFCATFPTLLATLAAVGPLMQRPTVDDTMSSVIESVAEQIASRRNDDDHDDAGDDLFADLEHGALDDQLVDHDRSSHVAHQLVLHALLAQRFADAKRVCDRVDRVLPFDADIGKAEVLCARGKIAEAQQDLTAAEALYGAAAQRIQRILPTGDDVYIEAVLGQGRIARIQGRLDDAAAAVQQAEDAVSAHEDQHHRGSEHECLIRVTWCVEAGSLYAAQWRIYQNGAAFDQALASFEQAIALLRDMPEHPLARHVDDMLHDLQRERERT